ncbi:ANTAR domain-containing protein [Streptomyces sp. JJ36]|uniref:ANTAR domain-containing protein n=1 Tax=Streptomyces sp. JJ36 TaxID=2736645 RepID=UPI001F2DC483|nr:ANTAR domain-containing protein [Streptomyces sp. JJ36]MCF6525238.1 ANTAR domain-containing protein [Streptomyces sp. JJ36]
MSTSGSADRDAAAFLVPEPDGRPESGNGHPEPDAWSEADARATEELEAEIAALRTEVAQLRKALESRPVIDQARGMIMMMGRCPPDVAWQILVEVSQHTNTKLREVAHALVATTEGTVRLPQPLGRALAAALRRLRTERHG